MKERLVFDCPGVLEWAAHRRSCACTRSLSLHLFEGGVHTMTCHSRMEIILILEDMTHIWCKQCKLTPGVSCSCL